MSEPLQSTKIRLQGTEAQIEEAIRRLRHVFEVSNVSQLYDERSDPDGAVKFCYLRVYAREKVTLLDQLIAAHADFNELHEETHELRMRVRELETKLGLLPTPHPQDVVLSPKHKP